MSISRLVLGVLGALFLSASSFAATPVRFKCDLSAGVYDTEIGMGKSALVDVLFERRQSGFTLELASSSDSELKNQLANVLPVGELVAPLDTSQQKREFTSESLSSQLEQVGFAIGAGTALSSLILNDPYVRKNSAYPLRGLNIDSFLEKTLPRFQLLARKKVASFRRSVTLDRFGNDKGQLNYCIGTPNAFAPVYCLNLVGNLENGVVDGLFIRIFAPIDMDAKMKNKYEIAFNYLNLSIECRLESEVLAEALE